MEYFKLSNGIDMPVVGSGSNSFGRAGNQFDTPWNGDFTPMKTAIEVGTRFFDTAMSYLNEEGIGQCLVESGIPREEFFLMGKIPNRLPYNENKQVMRQWIDDSLKNMRTDYFDMFIIHKAVDDAAARRGEKMNVEKTLEIWETLKELYAEGKFRGIGVSNFDTEQLQLFIDGGCGLLPMVNEIRCNPAMECGDTVAMCKKLGIQVVAHSPLSFSVGPGIFSVDEEYKKMIGEMGEKYGKSWAQMQLRYNFQRGIISIPKSHKPKNQAASLDIFDFEISPEEMDILAKYNR